MGQLVVTDGISGHQDVGALDENVIQAVGVGITLQIAADADLGIVAARSADVVADRVALDGDVRAAFDQDAEAAVVGDRNPVVAAGAADGYVVGLAHHDAVAGVVVDRAAFDSDAACERARFVDTGLHDKARGTVVVRHGPRHGDVVRTRHDVEAVPAVVVGLAIGEGHIRAVVDREAVHDVVVRHALVERQGIGAFMGIEAVTRGIADLDLIERDVGVDARRREGLGARKEAIDVGCAGARLIGVDREVADRDVVTRDGRAVGIGLAAVGAHDAGDVVAGVVGKLDDRRADADAFKKSVGADTQTAVAGGRAGGDDEEAGRERDAATGWIGFGQVERVLNGVSCFDRGRRIGDPKRRGAEHGFERYRAHGTTRLSPRRAATSGLCSY